jgi:hypothetical protein
MVWQMRATSAVLLVAALAGCGPNRRAAPRSTPPPAYRAQTPDHRRSTTPAPTRPSTLDRSDPDDDEPHAAASQLPAAWSAARAFFTAYIAYLYGRLPATRVRATDPGLHRQLQRGHATATPAERASRLRIASISTSSSGPPVSVVATARITDGRGPRSTLTATLERRHGAWRVVAVTG